MPQVKKTSKLKSKTARKSSKKQNSSRDRSSTRRRKNNQGPSEVNNISGLFQRLGVAGSAGVAGFLGVMALILWISGLFGMAIDSISRTSARMSANLMVAAGYQIETVSVTGRQNTTMAAIENALGPVRGMSLLHFDSDHARARIEELGWVRSASVMRLWPDQVSISIRERKPAAIWQIRQAFYLIDAEGAIIRSIGAREYHGLPLIVGEGAPEAASEILMAMRKHSVFEGRVAGLVRMRGRRWNIRLSNDMDIKLPELDFRSAIEELALLQESASILDRGFVYIDFRDPERVVFRCAGGPKTAFGAGELLDPSMTCLSRTAS